MRSICHPATSAEPRLEVRVCRSMSNSSSRCRLCKSEQSTNCCRPGLVPQLQRTFYRRATNRSRKCEDLAVTPGDTAPLQCRGQRCADCEWQCQDRKSVG